MNRLEHLKLWSESVGLNVSLGMISANQADLEILRMVINAQADVINSILDYIEAP